MDVVFLNANVLFSAAYRPKAGLRRLWDLETAELISSSYAVEEARRNLSEPAQLKRLEGLLRSMRIVPEHPDAGDLQRTGLPDKDLPILAAAVGARATHLLTGDVTHFGPLLGRSITGVRVLTPAGYLRGR